MNFRSLLQCRKGVTAVEFAIILPVLLVITFGIIEFSLIMFSAAAIESAANQGARESKTGFNPSTEDEDPGILERKEAIRREIRRRVGGLIDSDKITIGTTIYPTFNTPGQNDPDEEGGLGEGSQIVEFTVTYKWKIMTPLVPLFRRFFAAPGDRAFDAESIDIVSRVMVKNEDF